MKRGRLGQVGGAPPQENQPGSDVFHSLPTEQRHLFLQAVARLEETYSQVAGMLEPLDVA